MAFDDESFEAQAFSADSWLMDVLATIRREFVRAASYLTKIIMGESRL